MFRHFQALHQVELPPERKRGRHIEGLEGGPRNGQVLRIDIGPVHPEHVRGAMAEPPRKPHAARAADIEHTANRDLPSNLREKTSRGGSGSLIRRPEEVVTVDVSRLPRFARWHEVTQAVLLALHCLWLLCSRCGHRTVA